MTAPADLRSQPTEVVPIGQLREHPENYNKGNDALVADLLQHFGQWRPATVQRSTGYVLVGNTMLRAARDALGWDTLAVHWRDVGDDEARRILAADNRSSDLHETDEQALAQLLQRIKAADEGLAHTGYDDAGLDGLIARLAAEGQPAPASAPTLADRFIVPPFTVLDGRSGPWQERKRRWLALGIRSELGRGDNLLQYSVPSRVPGYYDKKRAAEAEAGRALTAEEFERDWLHLERDRADDWAFEGQTSLDRIRAQRRGGAWLARNADGSVGPADSKWASGPGANGGPVEVTPGGPAVGSSIFDPVLAELAVRWFSPPGGHVLDPFAGGSVRGIVAAHLGRSYEGVELRPEQVAANEEQRSLAPQGADLGWAQGDAAQLPPEGRRADLLLTCPPYAWLERYSDDPADLSTMDWPAFQDAHRAAISAALRRLAPDRFAVWVVGEVRTPPGQGDGHSVGLIADTIAAFAEAGANLYNELIYVTPVGSFSIRIGGIFRAARKVGRTHQHVLVFVKGDARAASAACGPVEVEVPDPGPDAPTEPDEAVVAAVAADEAGLPADAARPRPERAEGGEQEQEQGQGQGQGVSG